MEQDKISGTIMLGPGVAEELLGGSAYMVRDDVFIGVHRLRPARSARMLRNDRPGSETA